MTHWDTTGSSLELTGNLGLLERLRQIAHSLGCEIKAGSRLAVYERHLQRFATPGYWPPRDPDFNPVLLSHGTRDLWEIAFICEVLAPLHPEKLRRALPTLLSGPSVPSDQPNGEAPRNLQFELFLAAQLAHSGFTVALQEPDIVFVHDTDAIGVAAKRPISRTQIVRRVREAVDQLEASGGVGLVALCLDRLLPEPDPYVAAGSVTALDDAAQTLLQRTLQPYARQIHEAIQSTRITGLIVSMGLVGFVRVPWQSGHVTATLWLPRDDDSPDENNLVRRIVLALRAPSERVVT